MSRLSFLVAVLAAAIATSVSAQWSPPMIHQGNAFGGLFGQALAFVGDVDGDGRDDLAVGAPLDAANGPSSGRVVVYSGADGSVIHGLAGYAAGDEFGSSITGLGDIDGDGLADFAVGAPLSDLWDLDAGAVHLYSGADASLITTYTGQAAGDEFGRVIAGGGDLDGDGQPDLLVGIPHESSHATWSGKVMVYRSSAVPYPQLEGSGVFERYGNAVAIVGDVDGDGRDDFAIGAPGDGSNGVNAGRVELRSGYDGAPLPQFLGASAADFFGEALAGAGDVDGDGRADLAVAAPRSDLAGPDAGSVTVLSGATGAILLQLHPLVAGDRYGSALAGSGDVDGDGFDDLIVGAFAHAGFAGYAEVRSGADGSLIRAFTGAGANDQLGTAVTGGGDLDGDGFADFACSAPRAALTLGEVLVQRSPTGPVLVYRSDLGLAHGIDLAWLPLNGDPLALQGRFAVSGGSAFGQGLYLASLARIDYPAFGTLPLVVAIDPINLVASGGFVLDAGGDHLGAAVDRQIPWLAGWRLHVQAFELGPILASSPGVRLEILP